MLDSSSEDHVLERVRPRGIYRLLELVLGSTLHDIHFIASRYEEESQYFHETLGFLSRTGWLRVDGRTIHPAKESIHALLSSTGQSRDLMFASTLVNDLGPYSDRFAGYLVQFTVETSHFVHYPVWDHRFTESAVRDFLMDLGAVRHRAHPDSFVLVEAFSFLALWARNSLGPSQPDFGRLAQKRIELGRSAELAALHWEKQRVGEDWSHHVVHVADTSPAACYDIQSVTLKDEGAIEPRFIEVKAVAPDSLKFHWSQAELEAARLLGFRYFLYLVPIKPAGHPDVGAMEIVQNPYAAVYLNTQKWSKVETDIVCRKRKNPVS